MRMLILYGSQTGTAQDVAEQIWRESKRYNFTGPVLAMDEYPIQQLVEETLVVFVVATTGIGDEPDNMRKTWKFLLKRSLPRDSLQHLQFACLGLGDSSYAKFNYAAKKLAKRLQQLGASQLLTVGLCDDQHDHGLSAVALPWIKELWQQLSQTLALPINNAAQSGAAANIFKWQVQVVHTNGNEAKEVDLQKNGLQWPYQACGSSLKLISNERTTKLEHFQDVRLLKFGFESSPPTWQPGDVLDLRPCNSDKTVGDFFELVAEHQLDFTAETVVKVTTAHADMPVPLAYARPLSLAMFVKYHWDLSARPRQRFFELLALNCLDELEKEKLLEFSTAEGLDDMIQYINRPKRSILEVLQDFRHASAKLTLSVLFEMMPLIQARSFSIASIPSTGSLDLLVAVVEYKTKLSTPRLGLCSNWLKALPAGSIVTAALKAGTMQLPNDKTIPLVMVGPGTGIAPFRSIIQQRQHEQQQGLTIGPLIVFFGCRNKANDFHFAQDLQEWHEKQLIQLHVAFSRDQEHKVYVQHLIKQQAAVLRPLLQEQQGVILVAGSSKNMPKAVKDAFVEVLGGDEAYVEDMIRTKRYQEETWS